MKSCEIALIALIWLAGPAADARQELRAAIKSEPSTLDPGAGVTIVDEQIAGDLFEGLTVKDPEGLVKPGVAAQWSMSDGGKRWVFTLRPDARWSNGDPVTAQDFVFSWRRMLSLDFAWARTDRTLRAMKGAEDILSGGDGPFGVSAPDPQTLIVELTVPIADFPSRVAERPFLPVPMAQVTKFGKNWTKLDHFIGNGPFELSSWSPQRHLTLQRAGLYWDKSAIKLDKVTYTVMEDVTDQLKRFQAGDLDITTGLPLKKFDWTRSSVAEHLISNDVNYIYYLMISIGSESWTLDPNIRRALSLAIDRPQLTEQVLGGRYRPSAVYVPSTVEGYSSPGPPDWPATQEERRLEAKRLWALHGAPRPTHIKVSFVPGGLARISLPAIAQMWRTTLGVEVDMDLQEANALIAHFADHSYVAAISGDLEEDAESFLRRFASNGPGLNAAHFSSRQFDDLLAKATAAPVGLEQAALLAQAETQLLREAPVIPLFQIRGYHLVADRVKGFRPNTKDISYCRDLAISEGTP